ncbi:MAG: transposase [Pirellulaceae bacterium]
MPRRQRECSGGIVYHVLNRAVGRMKLFEKESDFLAFEKVVEETWERTETRILSYCVMPTHWHFLIWPREDGELSEVMRWLTVTHTQRWHVHYHTAGTGPLYQGRFKSFPVESDEPFLAVALYVERNALRANLVERAQDWRWSSLWRRRQRDASVTRILAGWPIARPSDWTRRVNRPLTASELEAVRGSVRRGRPFGSEAWVQQTAKQLRLESTLRPRGRPRKHPEKAQE